MKILYVSLQNQVDRTKKCVWPLWSALLTWVKDENLEINKVFYMTWKSKNVPGSIP